MNLDRRTWSKPHGSVECDVSVAVSSWLLGVNVTNGAALTGAGTPIKLVQVFLGN